MEELHMLKNYIVNFINYKELLFELVSRDLKVRYRHSVLGYLWSLLNPLLMMAVVSIIFSHMFRFDIENFPLYLLTGQTLWGFFSEATNTAMSSVMNGSSLIKKVYLPKYIFPVSRVLSSFVNFLFSCIAIVIMLFISGVKSTWAILLVPLPLFYLFLFTMGVGLILSIMATYFRDMLYLWGVLCTAWMYFTPIFYPVTQLPEYAKKLIVWNPLYHILKNFRTIILYGENPTWRNHIICFVFSTLSLLVGLVIFKKKQNNLILYI